MPTLLGEQSADLIIDMRELKYVDGSGLRALMQIYRATKAKGRTMRLTGLSGIVKELFHLTKIDKLIPVQD